MTPVVKAVPKMDAPIPILVIIGFECWQDSKFYSWRITVLLNWSDDLDRNRLVPLSVSGLHYFAERALAKEFGNLVCKIY